MKTYGVGIIGLGIMGTRMLGTITQHPQFHIAGVWDPSASQAAEATNSFTEATLVDSAAMLIASDDSDLIYIACPPKFHAEYAQAAIAAGKPMLCEKPLGVDLAESRALVAAVEAAGLPNAVNFTQACSPALTTVQERIASGATGTVLGADIIVHFNQWPRDWQVDADWLRFRDQGGFTREVFSHYVFLMERLFGRAELKSADAHYPADPALCESSMYARFDCNGVAVNFLGTVGGAGIERVEATVWGDRQSLRIQDWVNLFESDGGAWTPSLPDIADPRREGAGQQISNVAAMLEGKDHLMPSFHDALCVQEHIEAMLSD